MTKKTLEELENDIWIETCKDFTIGTIVGLIIVFLMIAILILFN